MTIPPDPPMTQLEYEMLRRFLDEFDAIDRRFREQSGTRGFRDQAAPEYQTILDAVAGMRAAVDRYEAEHRL